MKKLATLIALCIVTLTTAQNNTYTVDNKPNAPADFDNLQTAINTVPTGSTLLVQGSPTSYGILNIDKLITLKGTGYFLSENPNTQADFLSSKVSSVYFKAGSSGSVITGFDSTGSFLIYDGESNVSFIKNKVKSIGKGYTHPMATNINVINNYIYDVISPWSSSSTSDDYIIWLGSGSIISGNYIQHASYVKGSVLTLSNNVFANGSLGLQSSSSTSCSGENVEGSSIKNNIFRSTYIPTNPSICQNVLQNNIFYYSSVTTPTTDANNNKLTNQDPFVDNTNNTYSTDGRYQLKTGSVAAGAGVGGVDCGMFGGGYKLSGIPDIPNIYEFNVPTTGYSNSSGLQVNIKVKSNTN